MEWSNEDPRYIYTDVSHQDIVICRKGKYGMVSSIIGTVDTHDNWDITIHHDDIKSIYSDDKWDPDWYWVKAPPLNGR
jgi:hypothetical protein